MAYQNRIPFPYPLLRLNTSLLVAVAPNICECNLLDYGICQEHLTIYCNNTSVIHISKNPIQHSRTKHMEIWHHFIQELVKDVTLTLEFIHTNDQKANLFIKPFDSKRFEFLRQNIVVISMEWSLLFLLLSHAFASSLYAFFLFCLKIKNKNKNWKIRKIQKQCVFVYVGTYVPLVAIETKFLNFVSLVT